ncbi:FecR domain-containing protein [Chitinophaga pendula]|uniref:FecR domain-containing protein n=1 Tax=Chitinophaga TaxID=79328 RepID=UPI000BAE8A2E|nr:MULTISPECIES: FecR domain-containing protein [Chitinophaga]ASZ11416.1 hypothetical protein CK934_10815 [Chitinophaga sp. MD30]UCJ05580.1 FecR domain-containing protein [Chitinophaga pendula]
MSNETNIEVSEEVIVKYLAGEASPEEAIAIDDWCARAEANQQLFDRLSHTWQQTGSTMSYRTPDLKQEWQHWKTANTTSSGTKKSKVRTLRWQLAAAATVIILLGAALVTFLLRQPGPRQQQVLVSANSQQVQTSLPDQSQVKIHPGGSIAYADNFHTGRTVQLQTGEVYFAVQHDPQRPFNIQAGELNIRVIGTAFTVNKNSDSIVVKVDNGAVMLSTMKDSIVLKGGTKGCYLIADKQLKRTEAITRTTVNTTTIHRSLRFEDKDLGAVIRQLETAYGVPIVLSNPQLAKCRISTAFDDKPLQYVLDVISASLDLTYHASYDTIYLDGYGCD